MTSPGNVGSAAAAQGTNAQRTTAERAAAAERAVVTRHIRRVWGVPGTALGVVAWPPTVADRGFLRWNHWWQAHLLDCLVDAQIRDPEPARRSTIANLVRGIRLRNLGAYTNRYYDDIAWLGLALQRAGEHAGVDRRRVVDDIAGRLRDAWSDAEGGGIPWRRGGEFKNAAANGPAAILLARTGSPQRAAAILDWIDARLRDPATGLIWDGVRRGRVETAVYTYCQGVVLGGEVELCRRRIDRATTRIHRLVRAVHDELSTDGVLHGHRGGDSGLFAGILARYLALVANTLPGPDDHQTRTTAAALVRTSAEAAWRHAAAVDGLPLFGPDWSVPAREPGRRAGREGLAEGDLSVQLSGWMLLEAAHTVTGPPVEHG